MRLLTSSPDIRMATTLKGLAVVLFERGDFEEAEQVSRDAMKLYSSLPGSAILKPWLRLTMSPAR